MITRLVRQEQVDAAIESAYARLPEHERAAIGTVIERVMRETPRRGLGEKTLLRFIGRLGIYLAEHPEICGRFDDDGRFVELVRTVPTLAQAKMRARRAREFQEALRFFGSANRV